MHDAGKILVDGECKSPFPTFLFKTSRNTQIVKLENCPQFRAMPRQRNTFGVPGENPESVRFPHIFNRERRAERDDIVRTEKIWPDSDPFGVFEVTRI